MRTQYMTELESVRQNLVQMGETAISLLAGATNAVADANFSFSARASELEAQTDHQHRLIHDQCLSLITRQAPVARDARLVTGILDAIVDLELIGDYAYEIVALSASIRYRPPSQIITEISSFHIKARDTLIAAMSGWHGGEEDARAAAVRQRATAVSSECEV